MNESNCVETGVWFDVAVCLFVMMWVSISSFAVNLNPLNHAVTKYIVSLTIIMILIWDYGYCVYESHNIVNHSGSGSGDLTPV